MSLLKTLCLSFLFLCLVPSCYDDNKDWEDDEKSITSENDILQIDIPMARRAIRTTSEDPATRIETVSFLFFDGDKTESKLVQVIESSNPTEINEGKFIVKIPKNDYYLLVVANAREELKKSFYKGNSLQEFYKPISSKGLASINSYKDTYPIKNIFPILMTNDQGLIPIKKEQFGEKSANHPSVNLDLAFARIIVNGYPQFPSYIKDIDERYAAMVSPNPTKFYLMRRLAPLSNGVQETIGDNSLREDRYAYSYLYEETEVLEAVNKDKILNEDKLRLFCFFDPSKFFNAKNTTLEEKRKFPTSYVVEFTTSNKNFMKPLVSHIVLSFRLYPSNLDLSLNKNYYGWISYHNRYYMLEADFRKLLEELKDGKKITVAAVKEFPASFIDDCKKLLTLMKSDVNTFLKKPFILYNIKYYLAGYNYYIYPIRHFNDTQAPHNNSYGRYGIVRGNEYLFNAPSRITHFGEPHPRVYLYGNFVPIEDLSKSDFQVSVNPILSREVQNLD